MIAPGFNPKDTTETFMRKIETSQKRMEHTIARWEEKLKEKEATDAVVATDEAEDAS